MASCSGYFELVRDIWRHVRDILNWFGIYGFMFGIFHLIEICDVMFKIFLAKTVSSWIFNCCFFDAQDVLVSVLVSSVFLRRITVEQDLTDIRRPYESTYIPTL